MENIVQKQIDFIDESDRFSWKDIPFLLVVRMVILVGSILDFFRDEILPKKYTLQLTGVIYLGIVFFGRHFPDCKMMMVGVMVAPVVIGCLIISLFSCIEAGGDRNTMEEMFDSDKSWYTYWTETLALFGVVATLLLYM